jgi:hypothetical protein
VTSEEITMKISGKAVSLFFFKAGFEDGSYICNKCKRQKMSKKGYSNLVSHAKACYGDDFEDQATSHLKRHGVHVKEDGSIVAAEIDQRVIDSF